MRLLASFASLIAAASLCRAAGPVEPEKLFPFLPDAPEGWFAESPTGASTEGDDAPITVAGRNYFLNPPPAAAQAAPVPGDSAAAGGQPDQPDQPDQPAGEPGDQGGSGEPAEPDAPTASINIADAPGHPEFFESATAGWHPMEEAESGYGRAVEVKGNKGFETFDKERGVVTAVLVVKDRLLVTVELVGRDPAEMAGWLDRIDFDGLAALD